MAGNKLMSLTKTQRPKKCASFIFDSSNWKLLEVLSARLSIHKGLKMIVEFGEPQKVTFTFEESDMPTLSQAKRRYF